jgi:hypothetical protein
VIEGDRLRIRRPLEAADGERAFRELTRRVRRDVEHEEMRHPIVLLDDLELAVLLVASFSSADFGSVAV